MNEQSSSGAGLQPVDATPGIITAFASRPLRAVDAMEWQLATGTEFSADFLLASVGVSPVRAMLDEEGRCLCLWGATPDGITPELGIVWLVAAEEAERRAHAIHRFWRHELSLMHERFASLVAVTHVRNRLHHDWLRVIGFDRLNTLRVGPFDAEFAAFVRHAGGIADVSR